MFKMRPFFLILAVVSPISALSSITNAADYTSTGPDSHPTYVVNHAPEACKKVAISVDEAVVGSLTDKSKIVQALDGVKGSAGPDGAHARRWAVQSAGLQYQEGRVRLSV